MAGTWDLRNHDREILDAEDRVGPHVLALSSDPERDILGLHRSGPNDEIRGVAPRYASSRRRNCVPVAPIRSVVKMKLALGEQEETGSARRTIALREE